MDPFRIQGPACVLFSGGRTSAFMLRRIADAHDGRLPDDVHVLFANTGKERDETLDFVRVCGERWGIPITWIEYDGVDPDKRNRARVKVVTHATAARNGEPFRKIIEHRGYLPGPALRYCTEELKLRPIKWAMVGYGHDEWTNVVGLRADEPKRVSRLRAAGHDRGDSIAPLDAAGITEPMVRAFWKAQPFDLRLESYEGNCDLCHLKEEAKRVRIMRERPELAAWWIEQERWAAANGASSSAFRPNRPSFERLYQISLAPPERSRQMSLFDEPAMSCACTD